MGLHVDDDFLLPKEVSSKYHQKTSPFRNAHAGFQYNSHGSLHIQTNCECLRSHDSGSTDIFPAVQRVAAHQGEGPKGVRSGHKDGCLTVNCNRDLDQ